MMRSKRNASAACTKASRAVGTIDAVPARTARSLLRSRLVNRMPRAARLDSTLSLKHDPYRFIARSADEVGSDIFLTRLLLRDTICMTGPDAARLFYDPQRFCRAGGTPAAIAKTL